MSDDNENCSINETSTPDNSTFTTTTLDTQQHAIPPRYNGPSESEMSEEQRIIRQDILSSRPRTGLSGPFGPWLACPSICQPAQALGRACRYGTSLSFRESELIILLTAAKTKCPTEFEIHQGEALVAGLSPKLIESIPRDDHFSAQAVLDNVIPQLLQHPLQEGATAEREIAIIKFCAELLDTCTVSESTYQATLAVVRKEQVLVEITSIVGYYAYVAFTLNVFRIPSR